MRERIKISKLAERVFELTDSGAIGKCTTVEVLLQEGFSHLAIAQAKDAGQIVIMQHPGNRKRLEVYPTAKVCSQLMFDALFEVSL